MRKKVTYKLTRRGKTVYIGNTNNPRRRNREHSASGKKYDTLIVTSKPVSKKRAENNEGRNIKSFTRATGRRPKYNKTIDGKFKFR